MGAVTDLSGRQFGRLTVVGLDEEAKVRAWVCRCECGAQRSIVAAKLTSGHSKSCGCLRVNGKHIKSLSLAGQTFGRWTVVQRAGIHAGKHYAWTCRCECGAVKDVLATSLTSGASKSCGCLMPELIAAEKTKHGLARKGRVLPEYSTWTSMVGRCAEGGHKDYAGRGIYVCQRWLVPENFVADMGPRPSRFHSIDRRDNDGSYTCGRCDDCIARGAPMNCRWATRHVQMRNKRSNVLVTYRGETLPVCDWAPKLGMPEALLRRRLKDGWDMERAVATPAGRYVRSGKFAKTAEAA